MIRSKSPPAIILTGAGFSRNLGGWLANEAFEYLLGCTELNERIRKLLWTCNDDRTGFEGALARLQKKDGSDEDLRLLTLALRGMFDTMNSVFPGRQGPDIASGYKAANLLGHFDAVFTLNQDLLLEKGYGPSGSRYRKLALPGTKPLDRNKKELFDIRIPDAENFVAPLHAQPYYKLHGSSAFRLSTESDDALLIMGGDKVASIDGSDLLSWYSDEFDRYLAIPNTRLLVVGYSFGDEHINQKLIRAATANTELRVFIIDPVGVDVLDKRPMGRGAISTQSSDGKLLRHLTPVIAGASRRPFGALFSNDDIEYAKLSRFLEIDY